MQHLIGVIVALGILRQMADHAAIEPPTAETDSNGEMPDQLPERPGQPIT